MKYNHIYRTSLHLPALQACDRSGAILALLSLLILFSCGSHREAVHTAPVSLLPDKSQTWQLTALNGRSVSRDAKITTLTFNPEAGSFRGTTACNIYAGAYTLGEASPSDGRRPFVIEYSGSGSIRCPEADMNAEGRFVAVFQKANYILITEYSLSLYHDNKEILHFELR